MFPLLDFLSTADFLVHFWMVFFLMVIMDVFYALYTVYASKKMALYASVSACGIILTSAGTTIGFVNDHRMIIPAALGAFIGTYLTLEGMKIWESMNTDI